MGLAVVVTINTHFTTHTLGGTLGGVSSALSASIAACMHHLDVRGVGQVWQVVAVRPAGLLTKTANPVKVIYCVQYDSNLNFIIT